MSTCIYANEVYHTRLKIVLADKALIAKKIDLIITL